MSDFQISRHAVEQYRARVIACPERTRSDDDLRRSIRWQLEEYPMRQVRRAMVSTAPTHTFVIEDDSVVTTLGFMMRPKKKRPRRTCS